MADPIIMEALEKYGLSSGEIKIYVATLELGSAKVYDISKKAGIVRETTYGILNSLLLKGLVSSVIKKRIRYFEAASPQTFKKILREKELAIAKILPSLEELQKSTSIKPKVSLYEGKEGMKTVMADILRAQREILTISSTKALRDISNIYFTGLVKKREELGIKMRILSDDKPFSTNLVKSKRLPPNFIFNTSMWIYNNKVAMVSLNKKEPVGIIIEDQEIHKTHKNTFYLIWDLL